MTASLKLIAVLRCGSLTPVEMLYLCCGLGKRGQVPEELEQDLTGRAVGYRT